MQENIQCKCNDFAIRKTITQKGTTFGKEFLTCKHYPKGCDFFKWCTDAKQHAAPPTKSIAPPLPPKKSAVPATTSQQNSNNQHPNCDHKLPCALKQVKKDGPTQGKFFWTCPNAQGETCKFFAWNNDAQASSTFEKLQQKNQQYQQQQDKGKKKKDTKPNTSTSTSTSCDGTVCSSFVVDMQAAPEDDVLIKIYAPKGSAKPAMDAKQFVSHLQKAVKNVTFDAESDKEWSFAYSHYTKVLSALHEVAKAQKLTLDIRPIPEFVIDMLNNPKFAKVNLEDDSKVKWGLIPSKLRDSLLDFQKHSIVYGVAREGRVLIGDEMGLGKTIQAIALSSYYGSEWPLLILCPSSLKHNWRNELLRWCASILTHRDIQVIEKATDEIESQVVIVSYTLANKDTVLERILNQQFKVVICDESHYLKSDSSKRSQSLLPIVQNAKRAILLSGTLTPNRPIEVLTQWKALMKTLNFKKDDYGTRYCDMHVSHFQPMRGKPNYKKMDYSGAAHLAELHLLLGRTIMIRRLKKDVLKELPEKKRQQVYLDIEPSQMEQIQTFSKEHGTTKLPDFYKLTSTVKTKAVCKYIESNILFPKAKPSKPKRALFVDDDDMDDLSEDEEPKYSASDKAKTKFLVFAHHKEMLDALEKMVNRHSISYIRIDGSTDKEEAVRLSQEFRAQASIQVALLSITVAGLGLNFTPCALALFAELYWTPGTLLQAEDRLHRIGASAKFIDIRYLMVKQTIDDTLWSMIRSKLNVIGETLDKTNDYQQQLAGFYSPKKQARLKLLHSGEEGVQPSDQMSIEEAFQKFAASPNKHISAPPKSDDIVEQTSSPASVGSNNTKKRKAQDDISPPNAKKRRKSAESSTPPQANTLLNYFKK